MTIICNQVVSSKSDALDRFLKFTKFFWIYYLIQFSQISYGSCGAVAPILQIGLQVKLDLET